MIPLTLTIKNFMCYREDVPALDFRSIHIACLCGDNGNGKSALLDAITWVLWGEARTRTQEELVHQGQQDMAVELEFLSQGQTYRVSRRHSRSGRSRQSSTILELQLAADEEGNSFAAITGNTMRDTQRRIIEILHMDYETFTNTAFLQQGKADQFTRSTPAKRKECLAEVLDLSYYQRLEEHAKTRSRDIQQRVRDAENVVELRRSEIAQLPDFQERFAQANIELQRLTPDVDLLRLKLDELNLDVQSLLSKRGEMELSQGRMTSAQTEIVDIERQVRTYESSVADQEAILARRAEIADNFAALETGSAELERLNQALTRKNQLDGQKAQAEQEIARQEATLSAQASQLKTRSASELEPLVQRMPIIVEGLNGLQQEQAALEVKEAELTRQQAAAEDNAVRVRSLGEENVRLRQSMLDTRSKFDMLDKEEATCPLCNQQLGGDGQEHLRSEYRRVGQEDRASFDSNEATKETLEQRQAEMATLLTKGESDIRAGRQNLQVTMVNLQRDQADSKKAEEDLKLVSTELTLVEHALRGGAYAVDERRVSEQVSAELSALEYHPQRHEELRTSLRTLDLYRDLSRRLSEAEANLPEQKEALAATRQMLKRRHTEIQEATVRITALIEEMKVLPALETQQQQVQAQHSLLAKQRDEVQVRQGILEQQIQRCEALANEVKEQEQSLRRMVVEKSIYDELTAAFGKNGVQALIIEGAMPQLEADANEILGRLTENRMFLKLELREGRRDRATGQPSEEMDIRIADEVGTRSYETFSGGEAFRINFALRIALSKLLARRSGAPLPILFIDEGFGSQDRIGQERLTEAIQSIQNDFERIIVITHIEQVKDAFPVRIEVTKGPSGSTFTITE